MLHVKTHQKDYIYIFKIHLLKLYHVLTEMNHLTTVTNVKVKDNNLILQTGKKAKFTDLYEVLNKFGKLINLSKIEGTLSIYQATFDNKDSATIAAYDTLNEAIRAANYRPAGISDDEDFYYGEKNVKSQIK